jgi:hypothetical protein
MGLFRNIGRAAQSAIRTVAPVVGANVRSVLSNTVQGAGQILNSGTPLRTGIRQLGAELGRAGGRIEAGRSPIALVRPGSPLSPGPGPRMMSPQAIENQIQTQAQNIANNLVQAAQQQQLQTSTGRIFTRFDLAADVIENQKTIVTYGLFANNAATMSMMYTSSVNTTTQKKYYYEVYDKDPSTDVTSQAIFSLAYGHRLGSGSAGPGTLNDSPTRAIYSQYRLLLLNPDDTTFTFADGANGDSIYVVNFNRARLRDKLDQGNWEIFLTNLSGSFVAQNVHTGSNVKALGTKIVSLIDDSGDLQETYQVTSAGRVYNVVSGSLLGGIYNPSNPTYFGLVYPEMGVVVLNGQKLDSQLSFNTPTGSGEDDNDVFGDNSWKLYTAMSGALHLDRQDYAIQARNAETVTSTHYFVRVKNGEYNFSNNPTFVTGSLGDFSQPTFVNDPKTYITTVGMYNDRQELLAVAKLSQPVQKSFQNEALIKVKLDF